MADPTLAPTQTSTSAIPVVGSSVIPAAPTPTPTPVPDTPATINSANTSPSSPINYSTPTPVPVFPVSTLTPPALPTPTENNANDLTTQLEGLNKLMDGKSAAQTAAEASVGLPEKQATYNDLSARLTGLTNEANAIPLQIQQSFEGRGTTAAGIAPIQTGALRNNAIEALNVSTLLAASQGQITNAQAMANKMVAQKYDPITEQINTTKANLQLILDSPQYSLEQKNRAKDQLATQNDKQAQVDKAKADDLAIQNIAIEAAKNGADSVTLKAIQSSTDPIAAATAAGSFIKTADATSVVEVDGRKQLIDTKTGKVVADLGASDANTSVIEAGGRKLLINSKTGDTIKDLGAAAAAGSTGTATERQAAQLQQYAAAFVPGAKLANGIPVLDNRGFLTPEAFKAAVADFPDRGAFIQKYGYLLYSNGTAVDPKYGLTPVEQKLVLGAIPSGQ